MSDVDVSIIIVNYNGKILLKNCLISLRENCSLNFECVVVDNGSADGTEELVDVFPWVRFIFLGTNKGFASANNIGVENSTGNIVVLLNSDTVIHPNCVEELCKPLTGPNTVGSGGLLLNPDGSPQSGFTVTRFPTPLRMMAENIGLTRYLKHYDLSYSQDVDQPAGALCAISRDAWESVEGFDERFVPAWYEDVDLFKKLSRLGKVNYTPQAKAIHFGGPASRSNVPSDERLYKWLKNMHFYYKNRVLYAEKHFSRHSYFWVRITLLAGLLLRGIIGGKRQFKSYVNAIRYVRTNTGYNEGL